VVDKHIEHGDRGDDGEQHVNEADPRCHGVPAPHRIEQIDERHDEDDVPASLSQRFQRAETRGEKVKERHAAGDQADERRPKTVQPAIAVLGLSLTEHALDVFRRHLGRRPDRERG
jgi:hypothetical protein